MTNAVQMTINDEQQMTINAALRAYYLFGGSFTIENQNSSIDFTTLMNWLRSIGFVI